MPTVLANDIIVAMTLRIGAGQEQLPYLPRGNAPDCENVIGPNSPGWFLDYSVKPPELGLCPCTCDRVQALGGIDVIFQCGGGEVYSG